MRYSKTTKIVHEIETASVEDLKLYKEAFKRAIIRRKKELEEFMTA